MLRALVGSKTLSALRLVCSNKKLRVYVTKYCINNIASHLLNLKILWINALIKILLLCIKM